MTEDKFNSIIAKQLSNTIKCQKANYIINTDYPEFSSAKAQVAAIIDSIINKNADLWRIYTSSSQMHASTAGVDISVVSTESTSLPPDTTATTTTTMAAMGTITNTLSSVTTTTPTLRLKDHYDLVVFDLDDTLVPTYPPIIAVRTPFHYLFTPSSATSLSPLSFTTSFPT